jgi:hypothetical protein
VKAVYHLAVAILALGVVYASSPRIVVSKAKNAVSQSTAGCSGSLYVVDSFSRIYAVNMSSGSTQYIANLGTGVNKLRFAPDGTLYGRSTSTGRRVMVDIDTGVVTFGTGSTILPPEWAAPAYLPEGNDPVGYFQTFDGPSSNSFKAIDSDNPFAFHALPMNYPLAFNTSIGNAISSDGSAFYWLTTDVVYSTNVTNAAMRVFMNLGALELAADAVVSNVDDAGRLFIADGIYLYVVDTNTKTTTPVKLQGPLSFVTDVIWRPCPRGGVRITPTSGLITTESGARAGFRAVLTAAPAGNVTIGLTSSDTSEGTVFPASLTFTQANWSAAQNVTVSGLDDQVVDGDQPYTIVTSNAASIDPNYSNRFVQDVHVVNAEQPGLTATTIHSSLNPSAAGAAVTFSTSVIAAHTTPEGSVQFSDGGSPIGNTTLSSGLGSFTTSALPAGTRTISAYYPGDGFLLPSSATLSQEVKPSTGHPTTTALTSSINPSAPGAPVTLTASVSSGSGKNKPAGAVRFDDGDTTIGTVTLGQSDHAVLVAPFAGGTHTLRATYLGSGSYDPSVSPDFMQNVGSVAALTITSSLDPSTPGASVTFTATITGAVGNPPPTGTIAFSDGLTLLQSTSVIGGTATYTTSSLTAGMHSITAHYSGDSFYAGASAVVKQNVKVPHTH